MATGTIVVIDDDRAWGEAAVEILSTEGYDVEKAENGRRGLELLNHNAAHLVILDVHMPGLSGFEVLRELRQRGLEVPVLMVSSDDQAGPMAQALAGGATSFLRKPITGEQLLRAVRKLTGVSNSEEGYQRARVDINNST